jgi:acetyl-CoA carboxylase carboxyltransferase component
MSDVHQLLDDLTAVRRRAFDESRPEAVARQHDRAKLTARERVDALCDTGSFLEMGSLVEPARDTAFTADLDAPGDGLVTGTGLLDGRPIGLAAYDYTVLGGSNGHIGASSRPG